MRAPSYVGEVGSNTEFETNLIQGWLGHRSITSTAVYTALAPNRLKDSWRD
jgi:site-specific recombinase XerD